MGKDFKKNKKNFSAELRSVKESFAKSEEQISDFYKEIVIKALTIASAFEEAALYLQNKLELNSKNSSIPASKEGFGKPKKKQNENNEKKKKNLSGGQVGHQGSYLEQSTEVDCQEYLTIDQSTLPEGKTWKPCEPEVRQVIDIQISKIVTEYIAEVLEDEDGNRYVASFPEGVTEKVQYGSTVKAEVVHASQVQMIPYKRIVDELSSAGICISEGSVFNFLKKAYMLLEPFEMYLKLALLNSPIIHVDETGINISGKLNWLHVCSTNALTFLMPHAKRGQIATDEMGILPLFEGVMVHDHWKSYFQYSSKHALCVAHILRELQRCVEQEESIWAKEMKSLLQKMCHTKNTATADNKIVSPNKIKILTSQYKQITTQADRSVPKNIPLDGKKRVKQSKERNLLDRLINFSDNILCVLHDPDVPFSNNQAEQDLRMVKVQQKVSGCYRSFEGAKISARIRSFLSTCTKQNLDKKIALQKLFDGVSYENILELPT
jgi:transposase